MEHDFLLYVALHVLCGSYNRSDESMVLVGILSQFILRMMSVGYTSEEALTFMTITSIIAIPGSYLWGWLDSKFGTKTVTIIFGFSYIAALILLITSVNAVCV